MKVKFFDYPKLYSEHKNDYDNIIKSVLNKGAYILQSELNSFENNLKNYLQTEDVVGVADGTNALILSLIALGISSGDEVLLPSHTYIATASSVVFVGAKPVLCECNPDSSLSISDVLSKITSRTKAIIPVNLNGRTSDLELFIKLKKKYKHLSILEDSAQGLGSKLNNKHAGTFGDLGTVSFYPAKTLGCFGDGGAIIINNKKFINKIRMLRDHGRDVNGIIKIWGNNSRLDNLQAAILDFKLKKLPSYISKRRTIAKIYDKISELDSVHVTKDDPSLRFNSYQNYECLFDNRDKLQKYLLDHGVQTLVQWGGKPVHQFKNLGFSKVKLPKTDLYFKKCLMLPMNTFITEKQARYVVQLIFDFYK